MVKSIPTFNLYGEAQAVPALGVMHVERIHVRAHVNAWTILAHRHARLSQLFLILQGGGTIGIDAVTHEFSAPCLIWLPALVVHAFRFLPQTDGIVLTAAAEACGAHFAQDRDVANALETPFLNAALDAAARTNLERHLFAIEAEMMTDATGKRAFLSHHLGLVLIHAARLAQPSAAAGLKSQRVALVERFRAEVENNFRDHISIPDYASRLGVSPDRLHAACTTIAGRPPSAIVNERIIVEARRALIYTTMSVSEIAFDLGFDDPAYFSRFFRQRTGISPAKLRQMPTAAEFLPAGTIQASRPEQKRSTR